MSWLRYLCHQGTGSPAPAALLLGIQLISAQNNQSYRYYPSPFEVFNTWDTRGQEKDSPLRNGFFSGADGAILMFDLTSRISYKNIPTWHSMSRAKAFLNLRIWLTTYTGQVVTTCGNIPILLCGNKVEAEHRQVGAKHIQFHRKMHLQYYDISGHTNVNIEKPYLWLARVLSNSALVCSFSH